MESSLVSTSTIQRCEKFADRDTTRKMRASSHPQERGRERERERGKPSNTHHLVLIFSAHHNFSFSKEHPAGMVGMERSGESGVAASLELLRAPPRVFAS